MSRKKITELKGMLDKASEGWVVTQTEGNTVKIFNSTDNKDFIELKLNNDKTLPSIKEKLEEQECIDKNVLELLNTDKDWVVTVNTPETTKIFVRNEDELNKPVERWFEVKNNFIANNNAIFRKLKVVRLFIRSLNEVTATEDCFELKQMVFKQVEVFGTITSKYVHNERECIVLDDGTAAIVCIFEKNPHQTVENNVNDRLKKLYEELKDRPDDMVLKSAIMMTKKTQGVLQSSPKFDDLKPGNSVEILGKLSVHNKTKYIFIKKIAKRDTDNFLAQSTKELLNLYENHYKL